MILGKRILNAIRIVGLVALVGVSTASAQTISVTAASASPASVEVGDQVTVTVSLTNSHIATVWSAGGTVDADITFTNTATGTQFPLSGTVTISEDIDADGGTGTATFSGAVPTETTDSGTYRYSITISNVTGGAATLAVATTSSSDTILTITGQPDLKVTSLTYPAGISYVGSDTIPMSLTYTNRINSDGTNNVPYVPGSIHAVNFRIEVVLSSNPTFGDSDDFLLTAHTIGARINADGVDRTINWTQLLPGNFTGSYFVLAKMDTLEAVAETIEDSFTDNGNNIWYDINGSRIALDPSNFPTIFWGSNGGDNWSDQPTNNEDGRYTVYASDSTNLVTGDTNANRDVFIYDQQTLTIRRLSVSQQGTEGNGPSQSPFISADSTAVAFSSEATNLILGDTNGFSDIYVVESFTGEISRVNVHDDSTQANGSSFRPALSRDGQFVVFESTATNLIAGGTTPGVTHIYRRDNTAGTIELVSVDTGGGTQGDGNSTQARVSADGQFVVFASDATNLVAGDANGTRDIFLRDVTNNTTVRVSVSSGGTEGNGASRSPTISADGAHVAFHSQASNLVAGDTNGVSDVFSHEVATSGTVRVSVSTADAEATDPSGAGFELGSINPSISSTGRFVAFSSIANNLTDGDALGQYQATDANGALDVFVRDRDVSDSGTFDTPGNVATVMVSRTRFGYQTVRLLGTPSTAASDIFPSISADGRWVTFPSDSENTAGLVHGATNRTSPDLNTFRDVFVHDRRINALPNPSNDPTVSLTAPVDGSSISIGSTVTVVGSAIAPAGTVASVEFYVNGLSLGEITTAPYTVDWTPTVAGSYTLSALVVDSFGNQGVSTNVTVTVTTVSPAAPVVTLDSPANGATVTVNSATTLQATASDPDGTIATVEFFANGLSLGSDSTFPYTIDWFPTALGSVSLTVEATDLGGNSATSTAAAVTVSSTVVGGPTVAVTTPTAGGTLAVNVASTINATAADADGTITSVQFFENGNSIGTDTTFPYAISWTPISEGAVSLTAQATDNEGKVGESVAVAVTVSGGGAPAVSITSPAGGDSISVNTTAFVAATATDADGTISQVEFFANGLSLGADNVFPFTASWTPTSTGPTSLTAAATDNTGNVTTSTTVSVTVDAVSAGAPSASVSSPASGSSVLVNQTATVEATASDPDGSIAQVDFYLNGSLLGSDTTFPYSTTWTPVSLGSFALVATSTDDEGNVATSTTNTVTVIGGGVPTVSLTAPAGGSSFDIGSTVTVTSTATAVAPATVTSVQFLANGEEIGTDITAPYSLDWKPVQAGAYTLTAVVTDSLGTSVTSASVATTMTTTTTVTVDSPADSTAVLVNTATTVEATASDTAGTIAQVDFFANGVSLGADTIFPYSTTWTPVALGSYAITAVATDDEGNVTASTANIVTASAGGVPSVSVTAPVGGSSFDIGSTISVTATAAAVAPRTVTSVQFLANGEEIGTDATAPYSLSWKPLQAGAYSLTAVVTDSLGTSATSAAVAITFDTTTTVTVDSPSDGTSVLINTAATVEATASDTAGTIAQVEFFANGVSLGTDSAFPYTATWTPVALGSYAVTAVATDNEGNTTTSSANNVTASAGGAPTISVSAPAAGSNFDIGNTVTVTAAASAVVPRTVTSVEFLANGEVIGTVTTAPYSLSWKPQQAGAYSLTAVVTDSLGTSATSVAVAVSFSTTTTVTVDTPSDGSSVLINTATMVEATASDTTGTIAQIEFFANGVSLGTDNVFPYSANWTPVALGNYVITAMATDDEGNTTLSTANNVTASAGGLPTVSVTAPAGGSNFDIGSTVSVTAAAAAVAPRSIASVEFFANGEVIATDDTAPYSVSWKPVQADSYAVTAVVTDNVGTSVTSASVSVTFATTTTVTVDSPADGTAVLVNTTTNIDVTATDTTGTISQVVFLVNGVEVGSATAFPYTVPWLPVALGDYEIVAVATDAEGSVTNSATSTVTASSGGVPTVSLSAPVAGSNFDIGNTVVVTATPLAVSPRTVTLVQFLVDGVEIGQRNVAPYSVDWTPVQAGTFTLTSVVTDNLGTSATSAAVSVTFNSTTSVTVDSPADGALVPVNAATTITATASDTAGTIDQVEFSANGVSLGTDSTFPYTATWTPVALGSYTILATATDDGGNTTASTPNVVTVSAGNPPTVALTNPAAGAVVAVNSPTTLSATANDVGGTIAQVEFFADGNSLATDSTFPYSVSWTSNVTGSISLTAAATDDTGNVTTSTAVLVSVVGGAAPVATLTAPASGTSYVVGNPITLTASASATFPATIATVRFLANSALLNADATSPYTTTWTPTSPGTYSLAAEVTDSLGNIASSPVRTVTITENAPPVVSITNPASNQTIQLGAGVLLSAFASDSDGLVANVEFRANGISLATDVTVPYSFSWLPTSAGSYTVTAVATDNVGNVVSSSGRIVTVQSAAAPTVALTGPFNGQTFLVGSPVQVSALATASAGVIRQVEFLVNGASLVGANNPDLIAPFVTTWTPTAAGSYTFAAVATDSAGQSTISAQVTVTVQPNAAPAVSMISPTAGTILTAGTPITLIGAATDTDGTITSVSFLANGLLVGTSTEPPYSFSWTPGAAGIYALEARAADNSGNVTGSTSVNVTVVSNDAPTVTITAPGQGKSVQLGSATTIRAVATDSGGNITTVTFYANGVELGSDLTSPYEASFTPPADGIYRLVATATDNGGQLSSSAEVIVAVVNPSEDDTETVYTGSYVAGSETGTFTIARKGAISATFVARSDSNPAAIYYYDGISVDASGNFTLVSGGNTEISGTFGPAGLSGKFDNDRAIMIGVISLPISSYNGPVGVIHGSLSSQSSSAFVAIVAPDGRLTVHANSGSSSDVGYGTFNSDGNFSATIVGGGQMSGKVDSATGFLTGSAAGGSVTGNLIGAVSSATPASDGFLRNLSTRGYVGSGDQIMVAGFVVNGVAPKRILVRAIGPTLADFGVPGVVIDPTLKLYQGNVVVGSNDDWGTDPAVPAASSTVGAFALPNGSTDSALVATLVPGPYTAQVTGVNGATGVGLVEIYDVDSQLAFSPEKMLNVSTRGRVGPEELIAGVIINGVTPKRVMIRAVGPTLAGFGVSGVLADPVLRLVNQENGSVVRENNDWQMGNDALTVTKAAAQVGAFALPPGSKDAVLLITLPPGRYTALVTGVAGTSGIAIVEVYEIP